MSDALKLLAELQRSIQQFDQIPKGFKPTRQWAKEWGYSERRARKLLDTGVRKGLLIRKRFRAKGDDHGINYFARA
jgi:hypothetical protein